MNLCPIRFEVFWTAILFCRGQLAERYHYPAIDVPASVSRLEQKIAIPEFMPIIAHVKRLLSAYRERQDLIEIGAYASGSNPLLDEAIERLADLQQFLQQNIHENSSLEQTFKMLLELVNGGLQNEKILDKVQRF